MIFKDRQNLNKNTDLLCQLTILSLEKQAINMDGIGDRGYLQLEYGKMSMFNSIAILV